MRVMELLERTAFLRTLGEYAAEARLGDGRLVLVSGESGMRPGRADREQQVLALLAEGLPDRQIARRLVISERTVRHHVSAVLAKTGASSGTAAARQAARMGIGASTESAGLT